MKWILEHAAAGLFWKPGRAKTSTTLGALAYLKKIGMPAKTLVVAPLRVCHRVWPREVEKWLEFNHLVVEVLHGPGKEAALTRQADIYVINPEGLDWLLDVTIEKGHGNRFRAEVNVPRFERFGFDILVLDELSKFKRHETQRFKALSQVLHTFSRRIGLTGSPASNGLMGLFGQIYCLDMGRSFGPYITKYRDQYFSADPYVKHVYKLQTGAEERIYQRIEPLIHQLEDDLSSLPERTDIDISIQIPDEMMRVYLELESWLITQLDEGVVTAANAAVKSMKLRQCVAGGLYIDQTPGVPGPRRWKNIHTAKVDALQELVDERQGKPLLVGYEFEHDLDRLRKQFPHAAYLCDMNTKQFAKFENEWNRGEIELAFGHPASVGHGLNLQESGGDICWHTLPVDFELYDQFNRRIWRQGNESKKTIVYHLAMDNTIDLYNLALLQGKDHTQRALFVGLKEWAKTRRENAR